MVMPIIEQLKLLSICKKSKKGPLLFDKCELSTSVQMGVVDTRSGWRKVFVTAATTQENHCLHDIACRV